MEGLYKKTLNLLLTDERSLAQISRDAGIPYPWLSAFANEYFTDPGVSKVEKLYNHLKKNRNGTGN